jgi:hypothetical protein
VVPVSSDWRFQVRDAYRQHHKKNLRLRRSSIDAALNKLLERVEAINRNERLTHRVTAVVLFGSCLTDKEHPGDVDIAVDLAFRFPPDSPAYDEVREKMIQRWQPQFYSSFDWIDWPWRKVRQLIRARSRMLSIHEICELKPRKARYRVLYGDPAEIAAKLGYQPLPNPNFKQ